MVRNGSGLILYVDMTQPDPEWTPDQIHVYRERLAIMGEYKNGNTHSECVLAYRQAEQWKEPEADACEGL